MPLYCYKDPLGKIHEELFPMGKAPRHIMTPEGRAERCINAEWNHERGPRGEWPIASDAMGCHPDQVKEYAAEAKRLGVPTNFTRDGRPILENPSHRRRFANAFGYFDRNAGYSDPTPMKRDEDYG